MGEIGVMESAFSSLPAFAFAFCFCFLLLPYVFCLRHAPGLGYTALPPPSLMMPPSSLTRRRCCFRCRRCCLGCRRCRRHHCCCRSRCRWSVTASSLMSLLIVSVGFFAAIVFADVVAYIVAASVVTATLAAADGDICCRRIRCRCFRPCR